MRRIAIVVAVSIAAMAAAIPSHAQTAPETENGRYTLSPATEGVVRLDTRTGTMSVCTDKGAGWACTAMPEERAAFDAEIGRLQNDAARLKAENDRLKAQLASRDADAATGKTAEALPKSDSLKRPDDKADAERKLEIPLPSDRDIDRAVSFLEQVWRRLIDLAGRLQKDASGKI